MPASQRYQPSDHSHAEGLYSIHSSMEDQQAASHSLHSLLPSVCLKGGARTPCADAT